MAVLESCEAADDGEARVSANILVARLIRMLPRRLLRPCTYRKQLHGDALSPTMPEMQNFSAGLRGWCRRKVSPLTPPRLLPLSLSLQMYRNDILTFRKKFLTFWFFLLLVFGKHIRGRGRTRTRKIEEVDLFLRQRLVGRKSSGFELEKRLWARVIPRGETKLFGNLAPARVCLRELRQRCSQKVSASSSTSPPDSTRTI